MPQRGEIIQGKVFRRRHVEILPQFAEELGLLDAVDAQVGLQVGVQLDHLGRIAGLLDDEIDQERFEFRRRPARRAARPASARAATATAACCGSAAGTRAASRHRDGLGDRGPALDRRAPEKLQHVPQRREIVQGEIFRRRHVEVFPQFAEELGLLDAVDAQVGLQVGVQLDHLARIAGLLHNEVNQERFQFRAGRQVGRTTRLRRGHHGHGGLAAARLPAIGGAATSATATGSATGPRP